MGLRTSHNTKLPMMTDLQAEVDALRDILRTTVKDLIKTQDALNKAEMVIDELRAKLKSYVSESTNFSEL